MPYLVATSNLLLINVLCVILCCKNNLVSLAYPDMKTSEKYICSFLLNLIQTNRNSSCTHKNKTRRYSRIWKNKEVRMWEFQFPSSSFTFSLFSKVVVYKLWSPDQEATASHRNLEKCKFLDGVKQFLSETEGQAYSTDSNKSSRGFWYMLKCIEPSALKRSHKVGVDF